VTPKLGLRSAAGPVAVVVTPASVRVVVVSARAVSVRVAGVGEQLAQHGAERDQDADPAERAAEAAFELLDDVSGGETRAEADRSGPSISAMNGCTLNWVINTTTTAIPINAHTTSEVSCAVQCMRCSFR
jgi:hypothetical protein